MKPNFLLYIYLIPILVYLALLVGNDEVNLNYLIGKLFIPIAYIMGVPSQDVERVGLLNGAFVRFHIVIFVDFNIKIFYLAIHLK